MHFQGRQLSDLFFLPFWKGVYSKRKAFTALGRGLLSKRSLLLLLVRIPDFLLELTAFQKGSWFAGRKTECHKVSFKTAEKNN